MKVSIRNLETLKQFCINKKADFIYDDYLEVAPEAKVEERDSLKHKY